MYEICGLWTQKYDPKTFKGSKSKWSRQNLNQVLNRIERNSRDLLIWNEGGVNGDLKVVQQDHYQHRLMQIAVESFID